MKPKPYRYLITTAHDLIGGLDQQKLNDRILKKLDSQTQSDSTKLIQQMTADYIDDHLAKIQYQRLSLPKNDKLKARRHVVTDVFIKQLDVINDRQFVVTPNELLIIINLSTTESERNIAEALWSLRVESLRTPLQPLYYEDGRPLNIQDLRRANMDIFEKEHFKGYCDQAVIENAVDYSSTTGLIANMLHYQKSAMLIQSRKPLTFAQQPVNPDTDFVAITGSISGKPAIKLRSEDTASYLP